MLDPERDDADVLDDGTLLVSTPADYALVGRDPSVGRAILSSFGPRLLEAHDDARGVLFFPTHAARARAYEEVVAEVRMKSRWIGVLAENGREGRETPRRFRKEKRPRVRPSPALSAAEELARAEERLGAALTKAFSDPEVLQRLAAHRRAAAALGTLVLLFQRSSREPVAPHVLPDGTVVGVTDHGEPDAETFVADELVCGLFGALDAEHRDTRGAPCFRSPLLPLLTDARDYEDALLRLGAAVSFLGPGAELEEMNARRRKDRLRAYLDAVATDGA